MRVPVIACVAGVVLATSAVAEAPDNLSGPEALLGAWTADCDAWGVAAKCTVDWSRGLNNKHMTISYRIDPAAGGAPVFVGEGVYRTLENGLDGYWSDSGGAVHPLIAAWSGEALTTHWGMAGSEQGRSEYRLNEAGTMTVTDWSLTEQGWQQFMQVEYQRVSD